MVSQNEDPLGNCGGPLGSHPLFLLPCGKDEGLPLPGPRAGLSTALGCASEATEADREFSLCRAPGL